MLVDVVELRRRGVKRPREEVLAAVPMRAVLSLSPGRPGWHSHSRNPPPMAGLVVPGKAEWAVPPLDPARVTTIKSGALVVVGLQELRDGRAYESFPQAWWCRVVETGAGIRTLPATRGSTSIAHNFVEGAIGCDDYSERIISNSSCEMLARVAPAKFDQKREPKPWNC